MCAFEFVDIASDPVGVESDGAVEGDEALFFGRRDGVVSGGGFDEHSADLSFDIFGEIVVEMDGAMVDGLGGMEAPMQPEEEGRFFVVG